MLVAQEEPVVSKWRGTLNAMGTKLRLEIDISERGEDVSGKLKSLDQGNVELDIKVTRLNEKEMKFSVPKIAATFDGKFTSKDKVRGTFKQSGMKMKLVLSRSSDGEAGEEPEEDIETLKEAWVGELDMGAIKPVMQFRILTTKDDKTIAYFDSVTEGATDIEITDWYNDDGELYFEVQTIKLTFLGKLNEDGTSAKGVWSQAGREFPLTLEKKLEEQKNENTWENRPQKPVAPFPYEAEDVTFDNVADDVTLAGTLTIPKGGDSFPAVVLISGSGPQDRDESLMGHKPFLVLADYLSRNGIAVLRYDDRGTAKSTGSFSKATTEDFARDSSAAVTFLRNHPKIDSTKIGLCGHSEGGLIAPMVATMRDDVAFVVLMAGTGVDGKTIVVSQAEAMSLAEGQSEAESKLAGSFYAKFADLAIANRLGDAAAIEAIVDEVIAALPEKERDEEEENIRMVMNASVKQLDSAWMRFFLSYDPAKTLEKVNCPVLSIIGSKDAQVLARLNTPAIREALERGGNKEFEMVELEGLNHLFQTCETGGVSEYAKIKETFSPKAMKRIGDWIGKQMK
jgi:pimeloyl-ACP methyl ester carboxylesterase